MHKSRLMGIGLYVPSNVVTNHDLAARMDTTHEWIVERTGIEERRWVEEGQTGAGMAAIASREAIERAGLTPRDIDMIIYAEEEFGVRLPTRQVINLENVGDLVRLIQSKLN